MQYLLYYVVYFSVRGTTKEVFMIDIVDASLTNRMVLCDNTPMMRKVSSTRYKKANGIPSPSCNDTDNA
jgi:hypothetical protein